MPTPSRIAELNLQDWSARITNWIVTPFQATPDKPAGSRWWAAVLEDSDGREEQRTPWRPTRSAALHDADTLLTDQETRLEALAEQELAEADEAAIH